MPPTSLRAADGDAVFAECWARFRAGDPLALDVLAETPAPFHDKRSWAYLSSVEAARTLAQDPCRAPDLRRRFFVAGGGVVASPLPGDGDVPWLLRADASGSISRARWDGAAPGGDPRLSIDRLAERHGWSISDERRLRFDRVRSFASYFAMGRFELLAAFHADETAPLAETAADLAAILYPLWKPRALGLTLTYRCNARCDHCYNASGPNRSPQCLGWSEMGESLEDWALSGVTDVGLSGGEPFLYPELVIEVVGRLKRLGVPLVSPFSNGFWGDDEHRCRGILSRMRAAGFGESPRDQIKLSTGEFHAPYVPTAHLLRIARLHHEIVGTRVIFDVAFARSDEALRTLIREAKELGLERSIQWTARTTFSREMRCPVRASGSLYPSGAWVVCSGTSFPIDHRKIGNLEEDGAFTVLARAQHDRRVPYWQFGTFADYVADFPQENFGAATARTARAGTVCGTCRDVFGMRTSAPRGRRRLPTMSDDARGSQQDGKS